MSKGEYQNAKSKHKLRGSVFLRGMYPDNRNEPRTSEYVCTFAGDVEKIKQSFCLVSLRLPAKQGGKGILGPAPTEAVRSVLWLVQSDCLGKNLAFVDMDSRVKVPGADVIGKDGPKPSRAGGCCAACPESVTVWEAIKNTEHHCRVFRIEGKRCGSQLAPAPL